MTKELKYGQTPWDNLSREEMLMEIQRMYAALVSANSVLRIVRCRDESSPFWRRPTKNTHGGSGGHAEMKCTMILDRIHAEYDSEDVYRAFFRYVVDLLFSPELGFRWTACDGCPHFYEDNVETPSLIGQPCEDCKREGRHFLRRPLEWKDLTGK